MSTHVEISVAEGALSIRMNRPEKKNAIDRAMYGALAAALRDADADPDVRAILILGVPGAFSAGNDIGDFLAFVAGGERMSEVENFLLALVNLTKPLVAAVDGLAIGIGTTLLMHCDMVLASPASVFRTPFLDLGLVPEAGSSLIAPRLMGHSRAFALLAAGETFDAEAARAANLVTRIVDAGALEADALTLVRSLAARPPEAMRIARDLIRGDRAEIVARIRLEIDHFSDRLKSKEARQAFTAFMGRSKG